MEYRAVRENEPAMRTMWAFICRTLHESLLLPRLRATTNSQIVWSMRAGLSSWPSWPTVLLSGLWKSRQVQIDTQAKTTADHCRAARPRSHCVPDRQGRSDSTSELRAVRAIRSANRGRALQLRGTGASA